MGATVNIIVNYNETKTRPVRSNGTNVNLRELASQVKILCMVMTHQPNHDKRAIHVRNTWGSRCNKLLFVSNLTDPEFGSLGLQEKDRYAILWAKVKHTLKYAYENFYNDYDWFFKADDDTCAIMDNMRYMLSAYSPDDPIYFGKKFKFSEKLGYFSGGSGYVMSRKALKKFVTESMPNKTRCRQEQDGNEDWEMGLCMHKTGVFPGDARDQFKRETFLPFNPDAHLFSYDNDWYWKRLYYPNDEGLDCCSNKTISFHYMAPDMMYFVEYFVFNFKAYGIRHVYEPLPAKVNFTSVAKRLLKEAEQDTILH